MAPAQMSGCLADEPSESIGQARSCFGGRLQQPVSPSDRRSCSRRAVRQSCVHGEFGRDSDLHRSAWTSDAQVVGWRPHLSRPREFDPSMDSPSLATVEAHPALRYVGLLVEVIVVATLDVTLFALLFHDMDVFRDLVLIATMAGIMGAGTVTFSSLRSVSLTWIYIHGLGVFTVLVVHAEPHFRILAIQLCIYMFALTVGAVYLSASFQRRCLAEFQAESERQTVALLLDGFEGGSRDWLWECDTNGRFSHTSARLAEVAGMTVDELQQLTFGQLLTRLQIAASPEGGRAAAAR